MDAALEGAPMRRTQIALTLASTLLLGLTADPVVAVPNQAVGHRVNLLLGDQAFPPSRPFHIDHGFGHEVQVTLRSGCPVSCSTRTGHP